VDGVNLYWDVVRWLCLLDLTRTYLLSDIMGFVISELPFKQYRQARTTDKEEASAIRGQISSG
jgi:hypothetical protein